MEKRLTGIISEGGGNRSRPGEQYKSRNVSVR